MDKSKKRLITLLVILGYLVFVNIFPFPKNPSTKIEMIAIEVFKLILLIASVITIVNVWRKKRVKNKNNT